MKSLSLIISVLFLVCVINQVNSANYAVLVAGSNGFWNYRHQADTCHAYKTLITKGVPAENIIVFSYNDVASDPSNPFPGKLFNAPTSGPGVDVNAGCKIDYEGNDVNSTNYLNVITGQSAKLKGIGTGRVLNSTAEDFVFLNFVDHGASGLIAFPNDYLYADDFITALNTMHTKKMYKQLVYYLEACESGSMFLNLTDNINIYALSAANATESSWATYCSPDDYVNGTEIGSCLGDLFSVNWMQNTDASNTLKETLEQQWKIVANLTNQSSVLQWGQQTFTNEVIGEFVGEKQSSKFRPSQDYKSKESQDIKFRSSQNSRMVKLQYLYNLWQKDKNNMNKKQAFLQEQNSQLYFIQTFEQVAIKANLQIGNAPIFINDWNCLKEMVKNFENKCMKFSEFGLKYVYYLADVCENTFMEGGVQGKLDFVTNICKNVGLGIEQQEKIQMISE